MSTPFLMFLALVAACALFVSSTYQNALSGAARAGLLKSRTFLRVSVSTLFIVVLAALWGPAQTKLTYALAMASAVAFANAFYVIVMSALHGLDEAGARAALAMETLNRKAIPMGEWSDAKKLQSYCDMTYGRGKVNARKLIDEHKARQATQAT